jgi:hypothetical protein
MVHTSGHHIRDFHFRRLLRLAGSRWRYSTPPLHNAYRAVAQQPTISAARPGYVYQQAVTYAVDSHVTIYYSLWR